MRHSGCIDVGCPSWLCPADGGNEEASGRQTSGEQPWVTERCGLLAECREIPFERADTDGLEVEENRTSGGGDQIPAAPWVAVEHHRWTGFVREFGQEPVACSETEAALFRRKRGCEALIAIQTVRGCQGVGEGRQGCLELSQRDVRALECPDGVSDSDLLVDKVDPFEEQHAQSLDLVWTGRDLIAESNHRSIRSVEVVKHGELPGKGVVAAAGKRRGRHLGNDR